MVSLSTVVTFICGYLLTAAISVRAQEKTDIEYINEIFTKPITSPPILSPSTTVAPKLNLDPIDTVNNNGEQGEDCICVANYLCNNGTFNPFGGEGVINPRLNKNPCTQTAEVCCKKNDTLEKPVTPPPLTTPTGCGFRNANGIGSRITGASNNEAKFGEFPWMVAIMRVEEIEGLPTKLSVYQCGGALINPQAVITAAHCVVQKGKTFKVRAGEWDTQHETEIYPYQERELQAIEIHQNFYAGALYNDIAILILRTPLDNAPHIANICLPPQGHVIETGRGFSTGWGKNNFGKKGIYPVILKKIDLPMVSRSACQAKLRTTRLGRFFQLHDSFICAGGEPGKDTCKGDGGSPLVVPVSPNGNRYIQAGIVAWGIGCGGNGTPAVYVNVAKFRNWIDMKLRGHDLDTSTYQY